jgi:DNA polymerase-3 subunit delta'
VTFNLGVDMIWQNLIGHSPQIEMLRRAAARNRLAHAYLFLGPDGIGKRQVARGLAEALFCTTRTETSLTACGACASCRQVQAGSHPDLFEIGCPEGKRELPIDLLVGPKERRGREGLCHDLAMRPMAGDRRVAIIDDADRMNDESANALLKTLEEPPVGSVLVLVSTEFEPILPTIRSRCQPLWFSPLPAQDVEGILRNEGVAAESARAAADACGGSPATARGLLDPAISRIRQTVESGLKRRPLEPASLAAAVIEVVEEGAADAFGQRENAGWAVRFAAETFRSTLADNSQPGPSDRADCDIASASLNRCLDAAGQLHQSMPIPLCIAGLFDDLGRISRLGASSFL